MESFYSMDHSQCAPNSPLDDMFNYIPPISMPLLAANFPENPCGLISSIGKVPALRDIKVGDGSIATQTEISDLGYEYEQHETSSQFTLAATSKCTGFRKIAVDPDAIQSDCPDRHQAEIVNQQELQNSDATDRRTLFTGLFGTSNLKEARSRRQEQNRAAQRAFRQRKEEYTKKLENDLANIKAMQKKTIEENKRLQSEIKEMAKEIELLRSPNPSRNISPKSRLRNSNTPELECCNIVVRNRSECIIDQEQEKDDTPNIMPIDKCVQAPSQNRRESTVLRAEVIIRLVGQTGKETQLSIDCGGAEQRADSS